ncbi:hypothetical protein OH77DRAFT_1417126 [Trametes cingulata]|nr:hypothetical protein OH77DRAFT_1417126 [Trametes cingulata]
MPPPSDLQAAVTLGSGLAFCRIVLLVLPHSKVLASSSLCAVRLPILIDLLRVAIARVVWRALCSLWHHPAEAISFRCHWLPHRRSNKCEAECPP